MLKGSRRLGLAAVVATGAVALLGPTAALADSCPNGSATSIYSECQTTAKGPTHPKTHKKPAAPKPQVTTPTIPVTTTPVPPPPVVHPHHRTHPHKHPGTKPSVHHVTHPGLTRTPILASSPTKESSLGSAFDLGTGPTLLFALLAASVLILLGTGGVRTWRNRHRT